MTMGIMNITAPTEARPEYVCSYTYSGKSGEINLTKLLDALITYELIERIPGIMQKIGLHYALWYLQTPNPDTFQQDAHHDLSDLSYIAEIFENAVTIKRADYSTDTARIIELKEHISELKARLRKYEQNPDPSTI